MFRLTPRMRRTLKDPHFKFGLPFLIAMGGATWVLAGFRQNDVEFSKRQVQRVSKEDEAKLEKAFQKSKELDLEKEMERLTSTFARDDYEMVKLPRFDEPRSGPAGNKGLIRVLKDDDADAKPAAG